MVTEHKETTSTEVTVELDEDLIGCAVDRLQGCVTTELTDLGRTLVWTIPAENKNEDLQFIHSYIQNNWTDYFSDRPKSAGFRNKAVHLYKYIFLHKIHMQSSLTRL